MAKADRIQASLVFDTEEIAPAQYIVRVAAGPHADFVDIIVCFRSMAAHHPAPCEAQPDADVFDRPGRHVRPAIT